jgi:two-component system, NtrC family, sensor kinase
VPLKKESELVGAFVIYRQEVRPFSDEHIALVTNFAAQAVIAIENTRLLNELRESLQQQTATADVLKVISRSTFDLQTVLNTLVESASVLCEADMAAIVRPTPEDFRHVASYGFSPEYQGYMERTPIPLGRGSVSGRTVLEGRVIHIPDILADHEYKFIESVKIDGGRTYLGVPLLREGTPIGVIVRQSKTARPFTDKQIDLVTTFADQAVIAIENVRLFDEVQARTRELSESLEQQTATAEVLWIISSSPGELQPVFDAMLANATRLCEAKFGNLFLYEGSAFRNVCPIGPTAYTEWYRREPIVELNNQHPQIPLARARTKEVVHVPDFTADQTYIEGDPRIVALVESAGARSVLSVPMLKEGKLIGAIVIYRQEARPFTDKQIERDSARPKSSFARRLSMRPSSAGGITVAALV